jgi:tRNA wybutosine-synthesizing protein 1
MREEVRALLKKQHYALVGNHSGVKLCHWLKKSLLSGRLCYKHDFYGITSHRCLQFSPTINHCTQKCVFCWRFQGYTESKVENPEDPKTLLDQAIEAQKKLLTGFKGNEKCDLRRWEEANKPQHLACSLVGEPTLYPYLSELFEECHRRGMTTFLVTNGTNPKAIKELDTLPSQLYVTVAAPNKEIYRNLCRPLISDGWERLMQTLELLPSLNTRTVIRHTLVDGWNLDGWVDAYVRLDSKADPLFIEPKGYVFVGGSRQRLSINEMPPHQKIREFGSKMAQKIGYELVMERKDSRVVLLTKDESKMKLVQ